MKVNNISQLFYKLTNIKPYRCDIIKDGITNKNYKIFTHQGIYVLRMPRKEMIAINYLNQEKVLDFIRKWYSQNANNISFRIQAKNIKFEIEIEYM